MPIGLLYWLVFVVYVLLTLYHRWGEWNAAFGDWIIHMTLLFLLGWGVFGFVVRG